MTSPIKKNGTALSLIFDTWQPGTDKAAATGIYENGVDMADIYAPLKYGTAAAATGIKKNSADLNTIFSAKGTASYNDAIVIPFGNYSASSGDSHDAGSTITFTINPDGTWSIAMTALHSPSGTSGTPTSGTWHKAPAPGVGAAYEMQATANFTVQNNFTGDNPNPSYTATTGWLALSSVRQLIAATGHLLGGGVGVGGVDVSGYWTIAIRKIGGTQVKTSSLQCDAEAMV